MRRNVKNDKVLRAITIGLATMIAVTSAPVTAFASENGEGGTTEGETTEGGTTEGETTEGEITEGEQTEPTVAEADIVVCEEAEQIITGETAEGQNEAVEATDPVVEGEVSDPVVPGEVSEPVVTGEVSDPVVTPQEDEATTVTTIYEDIAAVSTAVEAVPDLAAAVVDTSKYTVAVTEDELTEDGVATVATTLDAVDTFVKAADKKIKETEEDLKTVTDYEQKVSETETELKKVENLGSYDTTDATDDADDAIDYADVANTAESEAAATEAKLNAENALKDAQGGLEAVTREYVAAKQAVENTQEKLDDAVEAYNNAVDKLDELNEEMADAKTNATAANERMKALQASVAYQTANIEKLKEEKKDLESARDQYYVVTIQYYTKLLGSGGVVYNEDGTLDVAACAAKAQQLDSSTLQGFSDNWTFQFGRDLFCKLIKYKISLDYGINSEDITIGDNVSKLPENKGCSGSNQDARQSTAFESETTGYDSQGNIVKNIDQVVYDKQRKNSNKETVDPYNVYKLYRVLGNNGDGGRTNRYHVAFTDNDGVEHSEYYNYVFRSTADEKKDFQNGPVFLARIVQEEQEDGTLKWVVKKDESEFNFDNYQKLMKAFEAIDQLEQYQAAVEAANAAADRVEKLNNKIQELKNVTLDRRVIDDLKDKLSKAETDLRNAESKKNALNDKVEEAEKAVAAIDLSRFTPKQDDPDSEGETEGNNQTNPPAAPAADAETTTPAAPAATTAETEEATTPAAPAAESETTTAEASDSTTTATPAAVTDADDTDDGATDTTPTVTFGDAGTTVTIPGLDTSFTLPTSPFSSSGLTAPAADVLGTRTGDTGTTAAGTTGATAGTTGAATGTTGAATGAAGAATGATGAAADADGGAGDEIGGGEAEGPAGEAVRPGAVANRLQANNNPEVVRLEDEALPLAAIPFEEGIEMNWWWLLGIFLLGGTGRKLYEDHKERKAAKKLNK